MNPGFGIPHSLYNPRQVPSSLWPQFLCLGAMGVPRASELTWGWLAEAGVPEAVSLGDGACVLLLASVLRGHLLS